jgi:hypothetical protein
MSEVDCKIVVLTPDTKDVFDFPFTLCIDILIATKLDEHAVSIASDGPPNPKRYDNLPAAQLIAIPVAKNGGIFTIVLSSKEL